MDYFSHVLYYGNLGPPFDNQEFRWPSFIGEFAAPIVGSRPDLLFWFTDYGTCSRFRIYTDDYESIRKELEPLRDRLGLVDKGEEKTLKLVEDLGGGRFIGPGSTSTPERRSELILRSLCGVARLLVDSVVKRPDGYWQFEENQNQNNPDHRHMFSVVHLYHNMSASDAYIYPFHHQGQLQLLSYYYFVNAVGGLPSFPATRVKM